jgi:hypothetical protein
MSIGMNEVGFGHLDWSSAGILRIPNKKLVPGYT